MSDPNNTNTNTNANTNQDPNNNSGGTSTVVDNAFLDSISTEHRNENIGKFKSANDLAKSYNELSKKLGQKNPLPPTATSTAEEREAWFKLVGRPDKIEDYDFDIDEDVKPYLDQEYFNAVKKRAFEDLGLTKKQFEDIVKIRFDEHRSAEEFTRKQILAKTESTKIALQKEWGEDYEPYIKEIGDIAKENNVYEVLSQTGLLNDESFLKFMHSCAGNMNEGGTPSKMDTANMQTQLDAITSSDAYKNTGHKDHKETMKRVFELNGKIAKRKG